MNGDLSFFKVAKEIKRRIYEEDQLTYNFNKTKDYIWYSAINALITKLPDGSDDRRNLYSCLRSGKTIAKKAKDAAWLVEQRYLELSIEDLIKTETARSTNYVEIDEDWKAKVTSYIFHIRDAVEKADIIEGMRERIFSALNQLQSEVDRNRTYAQSVSEVFLVVTEAIGKGAKNLGSAVRLVERLAGAVSGLRTAKIEQEKQLKLPAPEQIGLEELEGPDEPSAGR